MNTSTICPRYPWGKYPPGQISGVGANFQHSVVLNPRSTQCRPSDFVVLRHGIHRCYRALTTLQCSKSGLIIVVVSWNAADADQGELTSQNLWSRYDRRFMGITRYNALD